jgi:hypothetical protein
LSTIAFAFGISEEDLHQLHQSPKISAEIPKSQGGGYQAVIAVFHQLHCLVSNTSFTQDEKKTEVIYEQEFVTSVEL